MTLSHDEVMDVYLDYRRGRPRNAIVLLVCLRVNTEDVLLLLARLAKVRLPLRPSSDLTNCPSPSPVSNLLHELSHHGHRIIRRSSHYCAKSAISPTCGGDAENLGYLLAGRLSEQLHRRPDESAA